MISAKNTAMANALKKLTRYTKWKARCGGNRKVAQHGCKAFEALGLPRDWL
jgi:hypothetical protein